MSAAEELRVEKEHLIRLLLLANLGPDASSLISRCFIFTGRQSEKAAPTTVSSQITSVQPEMGDVLRLGIFCRRVHLEVAKMYGPTEVIFPVTRQSSWLVFVPEHGWLLELDPDPTDKKDLFNLKRSASERWHDRNRHIPGALELL